MPERPEQHARRNIDSALAAAGWLVQDRKHVNITAGRGVAIREFPLKSGHGFADYLLYLDGAVAGVVEAKKEGVALTGVELQTSKYSDGLPDDLPAPRRPLPFCYQSTGTETRFTNLLEPDARSRAVFSFHRPETLADWLAKECQAGPRARVRLLGLLRVCAGDDQPRGGGIRSHIDFAREHCRPCLFRIRCRVRDLCRRGYHGLAVRRFIAKPVWLGKISVESGVIALLIFLLMVTYLAGFWFNEGSLAGRIAWWAHTLTLLSFLPLIPHTKHLHLVLSPLTIFAGRDGFSKIPPLADDEDFGLDTGKDVTKLIALQAYTCVECGRCTELCPAYNTGKVLNPKEIILGMRGYLNELGAQSDQPLLEKYISAEAAFQCTTCGGCEYSCPVGIQRLPVIIGLRRGAVNTGKWEDDYGTKLFLTLERNGNSLGFPSSERQKFIEKHELPVYDGTQEYCLWLGCMGAYDPHGREIILAFARVMRHMGITFGVLRKEKPFSRALMAIRLSIMTFKCSAAAWANSRQSVRHVGQLPCVRALFRPRECVASSSGT